MDDGSCRINIDSRTQQECRQAMNSRIDEHIFENVQSKIFQLMKYDSYPRFLKSDLYKECLQNMLDGKTIVPSKTATVTLQQSSRLTSGVR